MINPNTFTVYNASAGSGKTYTLVKEYLLLLLKSDLKDAYKNILAITFTNKAVGEMKSRVISTLNAISTEPCPEESRDLLKDLAKETRKDKLEVQRKARKILKSILHNYASFDISTIDRFTHKIIRSFAKDLGIPVNFEVELNTELVLQEAVDRVINRAGKDQRLTKVLLNFTLSKTDDDKSWDITKDLFTHSRLLIQENHQKYVEQLKGKTLEEFEAFSKKLRKEKKRKEELIVQTSKDFFNLTEQLGLEKEDFTGKYLYTYFQKLADKNFKVTFGANWQETLAEKPLYPKRVSSDKQQKMDAVQPQIVLYFERSKQEIFELEYVSAIIKNITPLSLLSEISNEIENIKTERALILISDFNPTIAAEINDQPAPFIYERLGERYRNYFIDEFQDTSEMQWQNMIPLIDHALSMEHPGNFHAGLTLVGDAKQSIYRFRGGKAEQFINLYGGENPFPVEKNVIDLPHNYRSAEKVVTFNNSFFKYISEKFDNPIYKDLFEKCSQIPKKPNSGFVNVSFLEAKNKEEENEVHPEKVLQIIKDLEDKNIPKSDICILTRKRNESSVIANYLSEHGISIISSESLLIENSPDVLFINHLLEYSQNLEDRNLKWELLNYLTQRFHIENPHEIIHNNIDLDQTLIFSWLKEYNIHFDLDNLEVLPIYEAVEYIIRSFNLITTSNAYLQFYLDFVFETSNKTVAGIPEFLELWEQKRNKLSIQAPKTRNAVQIMTIHQSKGLEFPIVIYPFANTTLRDSKKENLWLPLKDNLNDIPLGYFSASDKMLNWGETEASLYVETMDQSEFDNINVLYVAFTRASQQLYIISNLDLDKSGNESPNKVSGLLIGYLKSINSWNDSDNYEFGSKDYILSTKEDGQASITPKLFTSSSSRNGAIQLISKNGTLWGSVQQEAINKGILVHEVLSKIESEKDVTEAITDIAKEENLGDNEVKEIEALIEQVLNSPDLKQYFSGEDKVYRERDIINTAGDILRPDRLNVSANRVTIIDYKTGNIQNSHKNQMEQYAQILTDMGYEIDKKILIYINNEVNILYV